MTTILGKIKSALDIGPIQESLNRAFVSPLESTPVLDSRLAVRSNVPQEADESQDVDVPPYLQNYEPPSRPSGNRWTETLEEIFKNSPRSANLEKFNHIYKVEQLIGYLDKDRGKAIIRQALAGILTATNIPASTLVTDGELRQDILVHYLTDSYKEMDARTDDLERQIESAEALINSSKEELKIINARRNNVEKTVDTGTKHIAELLSFLSDPPQEEPE
jgi:hypothetical protein